MLPGQTRITTCGTDVLNMQAPAGYAGQRQTCSQYLPPAFACAAIYLNRLHISFLFRVPFAKQAPFTTNLYRNISHNKTTNLPDIRLRCPNYSNAPFALACQTLFTAFGAHLPICN
jgi:hypothetical protein